MSSSFNYTTDVVDFEAMNITEMFPEASSFSFDMSSNYNHSYTDSISGVPLSQQALWDDGQLSLQPSDTSRVFALTPLSSLNNSANNSINLGHQQTSSSSRHLLVPPGHHGHGTAGSRQQHPLSQQQSYNSSPPKGDSQPDSDNGDYDEESSLQQGWVDETRDQNGIMLLNDKEHMDEQHLLFLQDIGAGSLSRGDSLSLFANLEDGRSCCLFFLPFPFSLAFFSLSLFLCTLHLMLNWRNDDLDGWIGTTNKIVLRDHGQDSARHRKGGERGRQDIPSVHRITRNPMWGDPSCALSTVGVIPRSGLQ